MDVPNMKRALRKRVSEALSSMSPSVVRTESLAIRARLLENPLVQDAERISVYLSMDSGEVQTSELISDLFRLGKRVFVPSIVGKRYDDMRMVELYPHENPSEFKRDKWTIPILPERSNDQETRQDGTSLVEVVVCPGVAFDLRLNRLGHGKGYYDSFLRRASGIELDDDGNLLSTDPTKTRVKTIGICFDEQVLSEGSIPTDAFDVVLDAVVTPTRTFVVQ